MKRFLALFFTIILIVSIFKVGILPLSAEQSGEYIYTISDSKALITGYTGAGGAITIPSTLGGYPVTSIENSAFLRCLLTNVVIPIGVINIGYRAFCASTKLESVSIPDSVTSIGESAFAECTSLTQINVDYNNVSYLSQDGVLFDKAKTLFIQFPSGKSGEYAIPSTVTSIHNLTFAYCNSLTSITIPKSVSIIDSNAFMNCSKLIQINVEDNNQSYSSQDGVLFDKTKTSLIRFPGDKLGSYVIPESVTMIEDCSFYSCKGLTSVIMPNNVTIIGKQAFNYCIGLTSVTIGTSVTSINSNAFNGCINLTNVNIPDSVTNIGNGAFYYCIMLNNITIPNNVTQIGLVGFYGCSKFTSVTIPSSVSSIGKLAFGNCSMLTQIIVDDDNLSYTCQDSVLFNKTKTTLIEYLDIKTGSYIIPNSVTCIDDYAFCEAAQITSLTIPNSVTLIGNYAVSQCTGLKSITIPNSVTRIGSSTFENCSQLTDAYFLGDAPMMGYMVFKGSATSFKVSYVNGKIGYTNPWHNYQTTIFTPSTAPFITTSQYSILPTSNDITVTASTDKGTLNSTSHTFTANGSFDFIATDDSGNITTKTVTITNIYKTPPVVTSIQSGIEGSQITGNVPEGSLDYQYIPTVTISIPTTTTIIKSSDLIAQDSGEVSFYTTSDFSSANKVSNNGITINGNSIILYTKIISSDNATAKYYKVIFNVVNPAKKYAISNTNFTPVGSNFLATVTIDRGQAPTLPNPKLLLIYTLSDGETQVFLSQNALVGANEVVVGAGVLNVMAVLVNGNVDWSAGSPITKSGFITILVPAR